MGVFAGIMVPRLFRSERDWRGTFVEKFQALIQETVVDAVSTGSVHKILFDFNQKEVRVERAGKPGYIDFLASAGFVPTDSRIDIPSKVELSSLVISGKSEKDEATTQSWFFVDFMGNVQPVSFVLAEMDKDDEWAYESNPFSGMLRKRRATE